jgi:hypothetical protein
MVETLRIVGWVADGHADADDSRRCWIALHTNDFQVLQAQLTSTFCYVLSRFVAFAYVSFVLHVGI